MPRALVCQAPWGYLGFAEALYRMRSSRRPSAPAVEGVLFDVRLDRGRELTRLRLAPRDDPASGFVVDLQRQE